MVYPTLNGSSARLIAPRDLDEYLELYRAMVMARALDEVERALVERGEAHFHVSGAGHEGIAVANRHLEPEDWLHPHYRDKALLLARGVPVVRFLDALVSNARSHSRGRQMSAHMSAPELRVLSTVGPVGNNALQAVGVAAEVARGPGSPIVFCSLGDGTTQEGEVLEAVAEAARSELPVLFVVEENRYAISTETAGRTFYDLPRGPASELFGVPILRVDGADVSAADRVLGAAIGRMRSQRSPAIVIFEVERLCSHTNADDERVYRSEKERLEARESRDPIPVLEEQLRRSGVTEDALGRLRDEVTESLSEATASALAVGDPEPALDARPAALASMGHEYRGRESGEQRTMLEAMRSVLEAWLECDPRVSIFGEDIEDPKGDVFGLTRGLSTRFGDRVRNSPLSESTIVGVAIGRALAGGRPVACIQFADFLPLAWNQIAAELGTMAWRTDGGWESPVLVLAPCGGYRPGLGPFHAQTFESSLAHVPGIDVVVPSTAGDAAGLLNAVLASKRPTVFLYPKICLNDPSRSTSNDIGAHFVPVGVARRLRSGDDLTLVSWGSTIPLCERAAQTLSEAGARVDLFDLRSIAPWDRDAVLESARRTRRLLVVHEDNATCGFGAEIVATIAEACPAVECRRVTRPDTYVPCNFTNQITVLPSYRSIVSAAAELVDFELEWRDREVDASDEVIVPAHGSSPADQSVSVVEWLAAPGDEVEAGATIAEAEADKAVFEIKAPRPGTIRRLCVGPGETVRVGEPLYALEAVGRELAGRRAGRARARRERRGNESPHLRRRPRRGDAPRPGTLAEPAAERTGVVRLAPPCCALGSRIVTNEEIAARFPDRSAEDIRTRTGIERRRRVNADEDAFALAVRASSAALERAGLAASDLDLVVCSTTTPPLASPTLACRVLDALSESGRAYAEAYDLNAACSGYLYALASAYDFLSARRAGIALVLTAEVLSPVLDEADFATSILFGDAASATILRAGLEAGDARSAVGWTVSGRPFVTARGERGSLLRVPHAGAGFASMQGRRVFGEAVRAMSDALHRAASAAGSSVGDLDWIVPHQANSRIIEAVTHRLGGDPVRVVDWIRDWGNTSSTSIPLCLERLALELGGGERLGLCAFGGGRTAGAAVLETRRTGPPGA